MRLVSEISENVSIEFLEKFDKIVINFDIESHRKERLLQGLDDIGITLGYQEDIASYEEEQKNKKPWLFQNK